MTKIGYRLCDLPIGKSKAYQEIRAGRLRALKCGRATLISAADYERWVQSLPSIRPITRLPADVQLGRGASSASDAGPSHHLQVGACQIRRVMP